MVGKRKGGQGQVQSFASMPVLLPILHFKRIWGWKFSWDANLESKGGHTKGDVGENNGYTFLLE